MRDPGYSLAELLVALFLLAALLAVALPPAGRWRDAAAVRAARDELAAALAWTRAAAAAGGGATLVLDPAGRFWTERQGQRTPTVDLGRRYGVDLDIGTTGSVTFRYDALGIGRVASRTVRIRRSGATAGITVSSYGRVRRW